MSGWTRRARPARAGAMRKRRTRGTFSSRSRSWNWCTTRPSSAPSRGLTRPDATCTSWPRSASRFAQRAKWRDFAAPIPRIRNRSSGIGGFGREHDHLLVVGMSPVAVVRHRQAGALAGGAEGVEVVVGLFAVVVGDDPLGLLDRAEVLLPLRVLVDRRVEPAARPQHLGHFDEAAHDRVQR